MPSQLIKNDAVYFICARNFLYNGVEFTMGEVFDPDEAGAVGQVEILVRTRRLYAVVDDIEDKPRHWHHHIWLRKDISTKLGLINRENTDSVTGSSLYNKPKQMELDTPVLVDDTQIDGEPADVGQYLHDQAAEAVLTEQVLKQENDEVDEPGDDEETEPAPISDPPEVEETEDDEREVQAEDLYDPSAYGVPEVLEYLTSDITDEERDRVLAAERNGKARKGILNV